MMGNANGLALRASYVLHHDRCEGVFRGVRHERKHITGAVSEDQIPGCDGRLVRIRKGEEEVMVGLVGTRVSRCGCLGRCS
jgi:hypothetical protein